MDSWNKDYQILKKAYDRKDFEAREKVAACILSMGLATGHGDTLDYLLSQLKAQVEELQAK